MRTKSLINKVFFLFLMVLIILWLPKISSAATIQMAGCSQAAFDMAYSSASEGDTVSFPSGACSTNIEAQINKKNITIQGSGVSLTALNSTSKISTNGESANGLRITGIVFNGCGPNGGCIFLDKDENSRQAVKNIRIDHCAFNNSPGDAMIGTDGHVTGVIDHNNFINAYGAVIYGGDENDATFPFPLGDANALFFEDNVITSNVGVTHFIASRRGSHYVIRYNNFNWDAYDMIDAHDNYEGWSNCQKYGTECRGSFTWEVYNNQITVPSDKRLIHMRGGQGVIHNNFVSSDQSWGMFLTSYMACNSKCSYGGSSCTSYNNCNTGCADMINHTYIWGNKQNCGSNLTTCTSGISWNANNECWQISKIPLMENRDYFQSLMPNYTPYIYPHPLQGGNSFDINPPSSPNSLNIR